MNLDLSLAILDKDEYECIGLSAKYLHIGVGMYKSGEGNPLKF